MLSSSDDDTTTAKEHSEVIKTEVGRDKCNRYREKKIPHKKKTNLRDENRIWTHGQWFPLKASVPYRMIQTGK